MVSRVAKNPIAVPKGVTISYMNAHLTVKGKHGELMHAVHSKVGLVHENDQVIVAPNDSSAEANALAGTTRALVNNMVLGVTQGFERKLELHGVGYRAKAAGKSLELSVGFSHPVVVEMPKGVEAATPSQTEIVLTSADKQLVAQVAANIRRIRPPEPYKGKGIRYFGEHIALKEGKKK